MKLACRRRPSPHRCPRGREPAVRTRGRSGPSRRAARRCPPRCATGQPSPGGSPATAMSPPRETSTRSGCFVQPRARRDRRRELSRSRRGRARRSSGTRTVSARSSSSIRRQPWDAHERWTKRAVAILHHAEGVVVSRRRTLRPTVGSTRPLLAAAASTAVLNASNKSAPTRRGSCAGVQSNELGVVTEAAAGTVDRVELSGDHRAALAKRRRFRDGDHNGRAERPPRGRGHELPETATGADWAGAATGGAGGGAGGRVAAEGTRAAGSAGTTALRRRRRRVGSPRRLAVMRRARRDLRKDAREQEGGADRTAGQTPKP